MTVPSTPADRHAARFKLPVEPQLSSLLIASLAVIAGGCQLFAWALARLPEFFLWFGLLLMAVGLGIGLAVLVRHYRLRWIAYVGPESFTVLRGRRRTVFTWDRVGDVALRESRLRIVGREGNRELSTLMVDRTDAAFDAAEVIVQAAIPHLRSGS